MKKNDKSNDNLYRYYDSVVNEVINNDVLYSFFRKLYWEYSVPKNEYYDSLKRKIDELKERFENFDTLNLFKLRKMLNAHGIVLEDNLDYAYGTKHLDYAEISSYDSKGEPIYKKVKDFALNISLREERPLEFPSVSYGFGSILDGDADKLFRNAYERNLDVYTSTTEDLEVISESIISYETKLEELDESMDDSESFQKTRQDLVSKIDALIKDRDNLKVKSCYDSRIKALNFYESLKNVDYDTKDLINGAIADLGVKARLREEIEKLEDQLKNTDIREDILLSSYNKLVNEGKISEIDLVLVQLLIKRVETLMASNSYNYDTGKSIEIRKIKDGSLFTNFAEIHKIVRCYIIDIYKPNQITSSRRLRLDYRREEDDLK